MNSCLPDAKVQGKVESVGANNSANAGADAQSVIDEAADEDAEAIEE